LQTQVDHASGTFVRDVALGRGIAEATVRNGFGEGAVVSADDALALGMVDRIEPLDETVTRVTGAAPVPAVATAQERETATAQERRRLRADIDRALLEWALD
jgi:ClpP class serine protease